MLELLTTREDTVELPLACDPAMQRANPPIISDGEVIDAPLLRYVLTADTAALTIPPGAMVATIRGIDEPTKRACAREAGRASFGGEQVYRRVMGAVAGGADLAAQLDALSAEDLALWEVHADWSRRWYAAMVRARCVCLRTPDGIIPGDELAARLSVRPTAMGERILREVGDLILRLNTLDPTAPRFSATSSGEATATTPSGSATAATATSSAETGAAAS